MILAGDIGGTNTRLALFEAKSGRLEPHTELTYPSREHASLDEIVVSFVAQAQRPIDAACFGIAGPVKDGRAAT
ncbi:MAG: glucokinase, partial [Acidobacteria bacterium]